MCLSFNIQNFTKKSVTQVQHTGFHAGTTGRLSLKSAMHRAGTWTGSESPLFAVRIENFGLGLRAAKNIFNRINDLQIQ
jgi:hypothetical protein